MLHIISHKTCSPLFLPFLFNNSDTKIFIAPEDPKPDDGVPAEAVEETTQEPEIVEESQPEPESTPADVADEAQAADSALIVDELSLPVEEGKVEESPSEPAPNSDDVKEEESAPPTDIVKAPTETGKKTLEIFDLKIVWFSS